MTSIQTSAARALLPPGEWRVDTSRSRVGFAVCKLGVGTVRGRFEEFDGAVTVSRGGTAAAGRARAASIATGNADRDEHLRGPGFLAAGANPDIRFRAHAVQAAVDGRWRIAGELTMGGTTRVIDFAAQPTGRVGTAGYRLSLRGQIDRRDFGLTWSRAIEATGAVSTAIALELDLVLDRVGDR